MSLRHEAIAIALMTAFFALFSRDCGASAIVDDRVVRSAALDFLTAPKTVEAVHVALPFATASYHGIVEGSPSSGQMLFRKYAFGWQLIDVGNRGLSRCELREFGISRGTAIALSVAPYGGPSAPLTCDVSSRTTDPSVDETAVRAALFRTLRNRQAVPVVKVIGGYAMAAWYGYGGGQAVLARRVGGWSVLTQGGGVVNACELMHFGVPPHEAHDLIVAFDGNAYDAKMNVSKTMGCPKGL